YRPTIYPTPISTLFTLSLYFFFFIDPPPTQIYTLSLHDALPIFWRRPRQPVLSRGLRQNCQRLTTLQAEMDCARRHRAVVFCLRSEEHTSELQSLAYLVCRLLLEKKKNKYKM